MDDRPDDAEPLRFNASNPVTAGIWRVPYGSGTAIRKVISGHRAPTHPDWVASDDPSDWLYWRREAEFYTSDLPSRLLGTGLRIPALLACQEISESVVELLIEDVPGRSGAALQPSDLRQAAFHLGRAHAVLVDSPVRLPWLSKNALRDHCASKHVDPDLLDDDAAWSHPLVRDHWPKGLRSGLLRLHAERERLFELAEQSPRVLSHLDFWSHNLIATPTETVVIDWAFAGDGAVGEDLANLVTEAALDLLVDATQLEALDRILYQAYVEGLQEAGSGLEPRLVRLGQCSAAVKWHWLGALHLERAQSGEHHLYGGEVDADPTRQYVQRGRALSWLVERADEALELAALLGR